MKSKMYFARARRRLRVLRLQLGKNTINIVVGLVGLCVALLLVFWPQNFVKESVRETLETSDNAAEELATLRHTWRLAACGENSHHPHVSKNTVFDALSATCLGTGAPLSLGYVVGRDAYLVNFWAFYCLPCREEIPLLQKYFQDQKTSWKKIFVHEGNNDKAALQTLRDLGIHDASIADHNHKIYSYFGLAAALPQTVLVRDGKIVARYTGPFQTRADIGKFLKKNSI